MTVKDVIQQLGEYPEDSEVHFTVSGSAFSDTVEVSDIYESQTTYGILTDAPTTVKIVVLSTMSWGL